MEEELKKAAANVLERCSARGLKVCTAESCTGGLVASSIVAIPHASRFFLGSAVAYCDDSKIRLLGVSRDTLKNKSAESAECAREMAVGAARLFGADIAVSTTGFLDANTGEKPAHLGGRVFFCVCVKSPSNSAFDFDSCSLSLDTNALRNANRAEAALTALNLVLSKI